ncbi:hypothetical protein PsunGV_gp073 [Pseudalatia unipuncta granulovirus]|uniref:Uncharacterized protein n=1 Tax=Pseudalatia unipuncta granulosis virus TaxID=36355 RepID=B6S6U2_GVPU|nr:hypothetical protein PsunGV_gp073 [Pseudalatia unipuncta granulovirus]ACH69423.1 unknown [Pseudalatia unipuncta granulovirus]
MTSIFSGFVSLLSNNNRSLQRVKDSVALGFEDRVELKKLLNSYSTKWKPEVKINFIKHCVEQPDALYAVQYAVQLWSITMDPREINDIIKQFTSTSLSPTDEYAYDALSCMYMYNEFVAEVNYLIDDSLSSEQKLCVVVEKHNEYSTRNNTTEKQFNAYIEMKSLTTFRRYFNMLDNYMYQIVQNLYPYIESECYLYWYLLRNKWSPYMPNYHHCPPVVLGHQKRDEKDHYNSGIAPIILCERRAYLNALQRLVTDIRNGTTLIDEQPWTRYEGMSRLDYLHRAVRLLNERLIDQFPSRLVEAGRAVYEVHGMVDDVHVDKFSKINGVARDTASEILFTLSNLIVFEREIIMLTKIN